MELPQSCTKPSIYTSVNWVIIYSGTVYGLVLVEGQANYLKYDDFLSIEPEEWAWVKYKSKDIYLYMYWRKCSWKCCLPKCMIWIRPRQKETAKNYAFADQWFNSRISYRVFTDLPESCVLALKYKFQSTNTDILSLFFLFISTHWCPEMQPSKRMLSHATIFIKIAYRFNSLCHTSSA